MKMNQYLPLILFGVLLNAGAQLALKQGMRTVGYFAFSLENVLPVGARVALNPFVLAGLLCYVVSVIVWLMALSRVDVSYAYPLLSVGYIVTALAGQIFFGESLGPVRWSGILVICLGVFLITRSSP
jgi:multidrug transporter EmrE-like cation transporter